MKTRPLILALAFGATMQTIHAAPAAETPAQRAGRAAISAAYTKMDVAMAKGNVAAAIPYFAPDYSVRDTNGKVRNRAQSVASLRKPSSASVHFSKIVRTQSFTWRDKDVKNILVTNQVTSFGKVKTGTVTFPLKMVSQSRDFWTLTPRGWKIRQIVKTQNQAWANGKRVR